MKLRFDASQRCLTLASVVASLTGASMRQESSDPAPPVLHELESIAAPEAVAAEELTFHRAPKPLAPDAVSEDWPMFRGPRRDGHTRETRLATSWPAEG